MPNIPSPSEVRAALSLKKSYKGTENISEVSNNVQILSNKNKIGRPKVQANDKLKYIIKTQILEEDGELLHQIYLNTRKSSSISFQAFLREEILLPFINQGK